MELTQDQIELRDLVRAFLAENLPPDEIRRRANGEGEANSQLPEKLAELGLDEGFCGAEAPFSVVELALVAVEFGAALMPEPLLERLACSGPFARLMPAAERAGYLAFLAGVPAGIAPAECCELKLDGKARSVSGEARWCFGGLGAGRLLGVASLRGEARVVAADVTAAGCSVSELPSLDLLAPMRGYSFAKVPCFALSEEASQLFLDLVELLKAAEAYGVARRAMEMTTEYVKTREQFGVPVGGFQAIQHKLADCHALVESLGSLVRFAAWSVQHSPSQRSLTARAVMSYAAEVVPAVCEAAIQCHGGIGFTWEYDLHLYLRRAKVIQAAFPESDERAGELIARAARAAEAQ